MQAVVSTKKGYVSSFYAQTYPVVDIHAQGRISLNINGNTVDFNFSEVLIVGIESELQKSYDNIYRGDGSERYPSAMNPDAIHVALVQYAKQKQIYTEPKYNCPS